MDLMSRISATRRPWALLCIVAVLSIFSLPLASAGDLALDPLSVRPTDPAKGETITVSTLLTNDGAAEDKVRVLGKFNNLVLYNQTHDIAANGTVSIVFQVKLNHTVAVINVLADPFNELNEADRSNNVRVKVLDLELDDPPYGALFAGLIILLGGAVAYGYVYKMNQKGEPEVLTRTPSSKEKKERPQTVESEKPSKAEPEEKPMADPLEHQQTDGEAPSKSPESRKVGEPEAETEH